MSPTPAGEPAKRRRTRAAEPDVQGTWLDLGPGVDADPDAAPGGEGPGGDGPGGAALLEEPDWLRDAPAQPELGTAPALDPEAVAAALEARRAARADEIVTNLNPEQARAVTTTTAPS